MDHWPHAAGGGGADARRTGGVVPVVSSGNRFHKRSSCHDVRIDGAPVRKGCVFSVEDFRWGYIGPPAHWASFSGRSCTQRQDAKGAYRRGGGTAEISPG